MSQTGNDVNEVSLGELLREVTRSWRMILAVSTAFAILGFTVGKVRPAQYEASTLLLPVTDRQGGGGVGGLASLASRYAGVAALAGVSLDSGGSGEEAIAVLKSSQIASRYIESEGLIPVLFSKNWDAASKRWTSKKPPTLWQATQLFKGIMFVSHDAKTGLVELTVRWTDPVLAARWANGIVESTNEFLRNRAVAESNRNIAYLTDESQKSTLLDAKQAIFSVMEDEINRQMLARGREEFALRVLDPAQTPELKSSPGAAKLFILLGFSGAFLSILFVMSRRILQS